MCAFKSTRSLISIYCDESCHLVNDGNSVMLFGGVWFPEQKKNEIFGRIKEIKQDHNLPGHLEVKWNKVSPSKIGFYLDLVNYFFDDDDLHFRCLIIPDKGKLDHERFNQTHDTFYYKMYFQLLKFILSPECAYNIYLDIKDTKSQVKVSKLHDVLCNSRYDFHKNIIRNIQQVRSHEVQALQLTDLLVGAMSYFHRGLIESSAKLKLIEKIKQRSGYGLRNSTLPKEQKFNIFVWQPTPSVE